MRPGPIHSSILPALERKHQEMVTVVLSSRARGGSKTTSWRLPTEQFYLSSLMGGSLDVFMLHSKASCRDSPGYLRLNPWYPHGVAQHGAFTMGTPVLLHHSSSPARHGQPESHSSSLCLHITQKSPHIFIQLDTHIFLKKVRSIYRFVEVNTKSTCLTSNHCLTTHL